MTTKGNVCIELESKLDGEVTSHQYKGEWFRKEHSIYIRYIEEEKSSKEIRHLIRYRPGELMVSRRGFVHSDQTFAPGQTRSGSYRSPYLSMQLDTHTHSLGLRHADQKNDGLPQELPFSLEWSYELYANEQQTGNFHIKLHLRKDV